MAFSSLKAVFGAEKDIDFSAFPKPPNNREITEDIEHLTADDPVVRFAELLRITASSTGPDDKTHAFSTTFTLRKGDLATSSNPVADAAIPHSLAVAALKDARSKISGISSPAPVKSPGAVGLGDSPEDSESFYRKLKQMSLACSKTEELASHLESKLRGLEEECAEFGEVLVLGDDNKLT